MPDLCSLLDPGGWWCQSLPIWGGWKDQLYGWIAFTLLPAILLWATARILAWRHEQDLRARELLSSGAPLLLAGKAPDTGLSAPCLVYGSVALSHAAVRSLPVVFRQLIGGRVPVLEAMVTRARREAVLRLREAAREVDAEVVANVRFETHRLRGVPLFFGGTLMAIEVVAFGTALRRVSG